MYQLVGFRKLSGTGKQSGKPYSGYQFYLTYEDPKVTGYGVERVYIGDDYLGSYTPVLGDRVDLVYNRWGNVQEIRKV